MYSATVQEKSPFAKQVVLRVKAYTQESTYE